MKLIDADALITQIRANIVQAAATERGAADPTYMAWLNAVLHLMTEEVEEAPESDIRSKLDALYKNLDMDVKNCEIGNLYPVNRKVNFMMAKNGWYQQDKELTLTAIKWCELFYAMKGDGKS